MKSLEANRPTTETTVLMPIGGKATRARSVTGDTIPKHLIPLGDRTVLDVVCHGLQAAGFRKFVFCVGHHSDKIREHIKGGTWVNDNSVDYAFSEEKAPLGVDGAILHAIGELGLKGKGLIVPGDVMLPWRAIRSMDERHRSWGSSITMGVTSYATERTTDVGKIIVENDADRVLWCYDRSAQAEGKLDGSRALTSAAATSIDNEDYAAICQAYLDSNPTHANTPLSLRDHVAPWASSTSSFVIEAFDLQGEVLDLGTPENILYGQGNWQHYA